ncbi:MAG: 3-methyl-2-oxobutanoate hydroxymethyltransferase [Candidatus Marinimicrobia bacterium]|nr:3-methyl-2-oxobutanoate hydroxymethyltransferase [Candidatus Neomarinimicrobiota bacterium]
MKDAQERITLVTCYDYTSAKIVNETNIDAILVGDSAAMVMHGYDTTINADVSMMEKHVAAVRRGAPDKFLIADMPFLAHRKGLEPTMNAVESLVRAGAQAVKIEGIDPHQDYISHIVLSGVPVIGHLGLTPQSVHQIGGYKLQGKGINAEEQFLKDARKLQDQGCFSLVLEMIPATLAKKVTDLLSIPTIGIGAGPHTSGQVLVYQDVLGMNIDFQPKFLRTYMKGFSLIKNALNTFASDVKALKYPSEKESF